MKKNVFQFALKGKLVYVFILFIFFTCSGPSPTNSLNKPESLRVEDVSNPLGIDTGKPVFSWVNPVTGYNQKQTAYKISIASSKEKAKTLKSDVWNSGWVQSKRQNSITYNGKKQLASTTRYWWRVQIKDEKGNESAWSDPAFFETALLSQDEWQAEWIGGDFEQFRYEFNLSDDVEKARAYVSGLGFFELRINGEKAGSDVLEPNMSVYAHRAYYSTHDVTSMLTKGVNAVGIMVGKGWLGTWFGNGTHDDPLLQQRRVILQLEIDLSNGSKQIIATNRDWKAFANGPLLHSRKNDVYDGEKYDARKEDDWDKPGYDDSKWSEENLNLRCKKESENIIMSSQLTPMKVMETIRPVKIWEQGNGVYVADMGKNISGWVQLNVAGKAGTEVTLKFAEKIHKDSAIDQSNLTVFPERPGRGVDATDVYILRGEGKEVWEPRFTIHGFRYVEITGFPGVPSEENIRGRLVYNEVEPIGSFSCSNNLLNKIFDAYALGQVDNLQHGMHTDCPQRDERHGWIGDANLTVEAACLLYDMQAFYRKWFVDFEDSQFAEHRVGYVPNTLPMNFIHEDGYESGYPYLDIAWSSGCISIPWSVYKAYGDINLLEKYYPMMTRFMSFAHDNEEKGGLHKMSCWFDHGGLDQPSGEFLATAFYFRSADLLSTIASELEKPEDVKKYSGLAEKIKKAFNNTFLKDGVTYDNGSQTANAVAVHLGLVPEKNKKDVLNSLVKEIRDKEYHFTTGVLGYYCIWDALCDNGYDDVAYKLASQDTYPSVGNWIKNGATTMHEFWDSRGSLNHAYYGGPINAFFFRNLAGIKPLSPGYTEIEIKPYVPQELNHVQASYNSVKGKILAKWEKKDQHFEMEVRLPMNTNSLIYIPTQGAEKFTISESGKIIYDSGRVIEKTEGLTYRDKENEYIVFEAGSGEYHFTVKNNYY